jgi:hypothetical protein
VEPLADREDLVTSLALAEDHLGMTLSQLAMVVDPGKRNVFEGKMPQSFQRRLGRKAAGCDFSEKSLELLGCHAT